MTNNYFLLTSNEGFREPKTSRLCLTEEGKQALKFVPKVSRFLGFYVSKVKTSSVYLSYFESHFLSLVLREIN